MLPAVEFTIQLLSPVMVTATALGLLDIVVFLAAFIVYLCEICLPFGAWSLIMSLL